MGLPQRHYCTEAEFAALARTSERRLELWDGQVYDMSYTTPAHRDIVRNLMSLLGKRLKAPCVALTGEPIKPPKTDGVFREPDLVVLCGDRRIQRVEGLELTTNPTVIIEVVSPET